VDINGDGNKEILLSAITASGSIVYVLNNQGTQLAAIPLESEITDLQHGRTSSSVLVAWKSGGDDSSIVTSHVSEFSLSSDMTALVELSRSPALLGEVSPNSMNFGLDGRLLIGTQSAMYIVQ
jgi:hypothetical protein